MSATRRSSSPRLRDRGSARRAIRLPPPVPRAADPGAAGAGVHAAAGPRVASPREAARHTTALVGIGHVGTRYATDVVLQFQAELAVAHEAVGAELPDDWAEQQRLRRRCARA